MNIFKRITGFIQHGDLIPLVLFLSVPHFVRVLQGYDTFIVAAALGTLLDIGTFRVIKLWMNEKSKERGNFWWMMVMVSFSTLFHIMYYYVEGAGINSIIFGLAPIAIIMSTAYIAKKEKLDAKPKETAKVAPMAEIGTPVAVPRIGKDQFEVLWKANRQNGHKSVAVLSEELGIPERTLYRWAKGVEEKGELHD